MPKARRLAAKMTCSCPVRNQALEGCVLFERIAEGIAMSTLLMSQQYTLVEIICSDFNLVISGVMLMSSCDPIGERAGNRQTDATELIGISSD